MLFSSRVSNPRSPASAASCESVTSPPSTSAPWHWQPPAEPSCSCRSAVQVPMAGSSRAAIPAQRWALRSRPDLGPSVMDLCPWQLLRAGTQSRTPKGKQGYQAIELDHQKPRMTRFGQQVEGSLLTLTEGNARGLIQVSHHCGAPARSRFRIWTMAEELEGIAVVTSRLACRTCWIPA